MDAYRRDLERAQEYAARNRAVMSRWVCGGAGEFPGPSRVRSDELTSCHHNYVAVEEIDGIELPVTRKGDPRGTGDRG